VPTDKTELSAMNVQRWN